MAGYYSNCELGNGNVGDSDSRGLVYLVRAVLIRFPAALKRYWMVFAVGFVLGNLMAVEQKTALETSLERIQLDADSISSNWSYHDRSAASRTIDSNANISTARNNHADSGRGSLSNLFGY